MLNSFAILITKTTNTDARVVMAGQYNFESNTIELSPLITDAARTPATMQKKSNEIMS